VRDVRGCAHLLAERHARIALGDHGLPRFAVQPDPRFDRHRRVHEPGQNDVRADAVTRVRIRELFGERNHAGFRRFVGNVRIAAPGGHRRDVDDHAAALRAHDRQHAFAREHHAAQVDRRDAIERIGRDVLDRRIAAREADADVVVQDIDASPRGVTIRHHARNRGLVGDIGKPGARNTTLGFDHRNRVARRFDAVIRNPDLGAFTREFDRRCTPVADRLAGCLSSADDDGDFVLQQHGRSSHTIVRYDTANRCGHDWKYP
jgi:hypothetical protein